MSSPLGTTISVRHMYATARSNVMGLGVPFPKGQIRDTASLALYDEAGAAVPIQARTLLTWPDDSIKWALVEFPTRVEPGVRRQYSLKMTGAASPPAPLGLSPVRVQETPERVLVENGRLQFSISKTQFSLFERLTVDGVTAIAEGNGSDLVVESGSGQRHYASQDKAFQVEVEERGPMHAVVKVTGAHLSHGGRGRLLDFMLRYHVYAGNPAVRLEHAFIVRQPPEEGVDVRSISAIIPTALGQDSKRTVWHMGWGSSEVYGKRGQSVEVSEGVSLRAREGVFAVEIENLGSIGIDESAVPFYSAGAFPGWERFVQPYVDISDGERGVLAFFQEMMPNYPKEIASEGNTLSFYFLPAWAEVTRLTRGISKRHWLVLSFHKGKLATEERNGIYLDWDGRLDVAIPSERYRQCQVNDIHRIMPYSPKKYPKLERKIARQFCLNWDTGWKDWGDSMGWGTKKAGAKSSSDAWATTPQRPPSWMNNEEDFIRAALIQHMRASGETPIHQDYNFFLDGRIAALHLIDIDFVDSSEDPLREGAQIPHAPDHTLGPTFPSHMWVDGLLMYYAMSGDPDALRAAKATGENLLRWVERRLDAVLATSREMGRPLLNFAALYEATHDERYRKGAEVLVVEFRRLFEKEKGLYHVVGPLRVPYADFAAPEALYRYWLATGDEEARRLGLEVVGWIVRERLDSDGMYDFFSIEYPGLLPFHIGYLWTGDEKYAEMGRPGLSVFLSSSPEPKTSAGFLLNQVWQYLKIADEHGWIDDSVVPMVHGISSFRFGRYSVG